VAHLGNVSPARIPARLARAEGYGEWLAGTQKGDAGDLPSADNTAGRPAHLQEWLAVAERQFVGGGRREDVPPHLLGVASVEGNVIRVLGTTDDRHVVERAVPRILDLYRRSIGVAFDGFQLQLVNG